MINSIFGSTWCLPDALPVGGDEFYLRPKTAISVSGHGSRIAAEEKVKSDTGISRGIDCINDSKAPYKLEKTALKRSMLNC
jgi:hypothetical protein